jgi:hypothetical protein
VAEDLALLEDDVAAFYGLSPAVSPTIQNRLAAVNIRQMVAASDPGFADVEALARLFEDPAIIDNGTVTGRLEAVLGATESLIVPGLQTSVAFHDIGFRGDKLPRGVGYRDPWPPSDNQVGHFLTAVGLRSNPGKLEQVTVGRRLRDWLNVPASMGDPEAVKRLVIGHELAPDPDPSGRAIKAAATTVAALLPVASTQPWMIGSLIPAVTAAAGAAGAEILGAFQTQFQATAPDDGRHFDDALSSLGGGPIIDMAAAEGDLGPIMAKIDVNGRGNSYQDLRLTLAGFRLADEVSAGTHSSGSDIASWVRRNLRI